MKRCPTCDASYDADAAWCPVDGARLDLAGDSDADDAGHTVRDMPTQLAATGGPMRPATLAGLPTPPPTKNRLKAATLPPASPRMTPHSLAAALAQAPAPRRPEPLSTPTSISVPLPTDTPTVMTVPLTVEVDAEVTEVPTHVAGDVSPVPRQTRPMQTSGATPRLAPSLEQAAPLIEVLPAQASQSMYATAAIELTAPVSQVSIELHAPITMPGVVAPEIRTAMPQLDVRRPPSRSDAPPMGVPQAVPFALNQPSTSMRPLAPARSRRWMWIAIALIIVAGTLAMILALQ